MLTARTISQVEYSFYEPSVSPNGLKLAVIGVNQSSFRGDVFTFSIANDADLTNVSTNAVKDANTGNTTSSLWVDYSPDGTQLAVANYIDADGSDSTRVVKLPVAGGAYTNVLSSVVDGDGSNWYYSEAHWSPVGDMMITHRNQVQGSDSRHLRGLTNSILQDFRGLRTVSSTNPDPSTGFTDLLLGEVGPAWWTVGTAPVVVVTPGLPNVGSVK